MGNLAIEPARSILRDGVARRVFPSAVAEVLQQFGKQSRTPIDLTNVPEDARVTVSLRKAPYWVALEELCRASGAFEAEPEEADLAATHPNGGSVLADKVVLPLWSDLRADLASRLESVSLDDLCQRARSAGIESQSGDCIDFNI